MLMDMIVGLQMEENKIMTKTELRKIINFYWAAEEDSHKMCGR